MPGRVMGRSLLGTLALILRRLTMPKRPKPNRTPATLPPLETPDPLGPAPKTKGGRPRGRREVANRGSYGALLALSLAGLRARATAVIVRMRPR